MGAHPLAVPVDELAARHGFADEVALGNVAAEARHRLPVLLAFHALGDALELEALGHGDAGAEQSLQHVLLRFAAPVTKSWSILSSMNGTRVSCCIDEKPVP